MARQDDKKEGSGKKAINAGWTAASVAGKAYSFWKLRNLLLLAAIGTLAFGFGMSLVAMWHVAGSPGRWVAGQCEDALGSWNPTSTQPVTGAQQVGVVVRDPQTATLQVITAGPGSDHLVALPLETSSVPTTPNSPLLDGSDTTTTLTENPGASLTLDPSDRGRVPAFLAQCLDSRVMATQPALVATWRTPNLGPSVQCAQDLALEQLKAGNAGSSGSADASSPAAAFARNLIYHASQAGVAGHTCVPQGNSAPEVRSQGCGAVDRTGQGHTIILPEKAYEQAFCGEIVDPSAATPGDLVFWNYHGGNWTDMTDMKIKRVLSGSQIPVHPN